jgi:23S rRNA (cytidine1920-2'-O)/16S rRNA (cytidine1409-2'-O)-methyltransferase
MKKERLDVLLLEKGLFDSRQKAQSAIISRIIQVDNKIIDKAGTLISPEAEIILLRAVEEKYVSRGGFKLEKALETFKPTVKDLTFLDIGASTGGFTDCLLKNGAKFVYAIDVGYGQIDWGIRQDPRVKVIERCNARYLTPEELYKNGEEKAQGCVIDVAFISLDKIIPNLLTLLADDFFIIALIKPQFEAGKGKVKKGVVIDKEIHKEVIENVATFLNTINLHLTELTYSPIKGPSGNIEFLGFITKNKNDAVNIENTVNLAHTGAS